MLIDEKALQINGQLNEQMERHRVASRLKNAINPYCDLVYLFKQVYHLWTRGHEDSMEINTVS